jgi:hypothetical protein
VRASRFWFYRLWMIETGVRLRTAICDGGHFSLLLPKGGMV